MINIQNKVDCCGCNACGDACSKQAITFKTDNEGFWYPEVDMQKCVDCGSCEKVCPIINIKDLKKNDFAKPVHTYAAIHKNNEIRFDSTSGGLFSALAEKMYRDGGYVGGAVYDEDFNIKHFISNQKEDLKKLRSSKYAQSDLTGFYIQVRDLLRKGEKVLVCGSPCQMVALRAFLRKDYENLLILDYVCRGINSPKIGKKFEADLEKEFGSRIVWQKAKNKELGWRTMAAKFIFEDGRSHFIPASKNPMTKGYLMTNVFSRPSCYDCKFKGLPRMADITLADFWGIEKYDKTLDDDIGTSLVLINSKKGEEYFGKIQQKIKSIELPFETALKGNPMIMNSQPLPLVNRDIFYTDLNKLTFSEVAEKYFPISDKLTFKQKVKHLLRIGKKMYLFSRENLFFIFKFLRKNFASNIKHNWKNDGFFYLSRYTVAQISKKANITLNAPFSLGFPRVQGSRCESRLLIEDGATFTVNSEFGCGYGCDIEVFKNATLIIHDDLFNTKGGGPNMGLTLICGNRIEIGEDCRIGRNVTIRDNNGNHYLSSQGYKVSKPVIIGKHVWLCEACTIMQGVKIGDGSIIGAHSVVYTNVPPYSLVSGNPAKVIQSDIHWKY